MYICNCTLICIISMSLNLHLPCPPVFCLSVTGICMDRLIQGNGKTYLGLTVMDKVMDRQNFD